MARRFMVLRSKMSRGPRCWYPVGRRLMCVQFWVVALPVVERVGNQYTLIFPAVTCGEGSIDMFLGSARFFPVRAFFLLLCDVVRVVLLVMRAGCWA